MKKLCFILAVGMMLSMTTTASAQFMGSPSRSRNYVSADAFTTFWLGYAPISLKYDDVSLSGINLFSIGISNATPLAGSSFLAEFGGYVDWVNWKRSESGDAVRVNIVGAKVPINLMYPFALADGITVYPYAGLNARVLVFGQASANYDGEKETVDIFSIDDSDVDLKRVSLGYQVGFRARISNLMVGIGYEEMLTSLIDEDMVKIGGLTLSLGFPF